jgi:acetylornithine deacetylase/succinyl-diaminopimelate desuccinylase-like protein
MNKKELLDPLLHLLSIPSISMQEEYLPKMEEARHYLLDLFGSMGFTTKILKGKRHDAVFAQSTVHPSLPTVLIYGHYDVQPADPVDEWNTDAFTPTIKKNVLYARGATDDKGQFMIHVMAVKKMLSSMRKGDTLPVNFKFLIEGEEEIGSISVESLARKYGKTLFKCDYLLVSDSEMYKKGQPSIDISLRGLAYAEIELRTSKQDLHSGQFGGVADNPVNLLSHLITNLKDAQNKVLIPGFYDDVLPPTKEELHDYNSLKTTKEQIRSDGHLINTIGGGEQRYSINERRWSRPTFDVNGIWGGYQGEGSKTIIPAKAGAKVSMRLVPNQDPDKIYEAFVNHVKDVCMKLGITGISLSFKKHASALPYKAPTNHPVFGIMKKSLKKAFGKEPVFTGVGGTIGFVPVIANTLNVPCIMVGFGLPDDNLHSPNEHFALDNYYKGIDTMVDFYNHLPK